MVFIVAEIGINWDGDFNLLRDMVKKSKDSGCQAVKFQAFKKEMVKNHPDSSRLIKSSISKENIKEVNKICNDIGIEWFCTPMYEEAVELLDPYVRRFKIREYDGQEIIENRQSELFRKIWETGKEIIFSTTKSPKSCSLYKESRIKWLYCVPKYPTKLKELDFSTLSEFNGYSNHSTELIAPISAAILGAKIIEIHVTSDKEKNFVDNNVSLDFRELKEVCQQIRLSEEIKK